MPWHYILHDLDERGSTFWLFHTQRKFYVALHQNQFRQTYSLGVQSLLHSMYYNSQLHATSTSRNTLSHTRKHHCSSSQAPDGSDGRVCDSRALSASNILVTFNNASLTLWPGRLDIRPPLWGTFLELGSTVSKAAKATLTVLSTIGTRQSKSLTLSSDTSTPPTVPPSTSSFPATLGPKVLWQCSQAVSMPAA